jgi:Fe2+ or Zn2+ uptake regulation protein
MNNNYKRSRQREEILKVLRQTTSHPTADWVYAKLKNKHPKLSLGTVYRNLNILKEQGEILELSFGSTFDRFDGNPRHHYHFICEDCGKVFDVAMPTENRLNQKAQSNSPFKINSHRLEFFGFCQNCLGSKKGVAIQPSPPFPLGEGWLQQTARL